ncbi:hypothetical protein PPROV_001111200 [Pycnococcus provasolii]|uniref:Translation machinery associated TMA7 n=1 Tax=Pycnococcus provasolii TaxID=41880 RepID=A0A830HZ50_9CHLO|nr:hypothetical protein PPROV_001111200 [Pycnococcus provasolii]
MPLGGATNKAQRSVVDKKGKGKGKGGGDDFDEDNAFKAKQKADAAALKAMQEKAKNGGLGAGLKKSGKK